MKPAASRPGLSLGRLLERLLSLEPRASDPIGVPCWGRCGALEVVLKPRFQGPRPSSHWEAWHSRDLMVTRLPGELRKLALTRPLPSTSSENLWESQRGSAGGFWARALRGGG